MRAALEPALASLQRHVRDVYLHLDVDALDPQEAPANGFQPEGGLSVPQVEEAIDLIAGSLSLRAAALTAYDPAHDPDGHMALAASRLGTRMLGPGGTQDKLHG